MKATINGVVVAESSQPVNLEGNYYFPPDSVNQQIFVPSPTAYTCPWKGKAAYWSANIGGQTISDIAWSYPQPKDAAKNITGHFAFDRKKVILEG